VTGDLVEVVRGDVTLSVRVAGPADGHPVVLLHGFPDTGDIWHDQVDALAAAGHRVAAPDMRGCGRSSKPVGDEAYAISELIGDVAAICTTLGLGRPTIVGHDIGAALAWSIAIGAPALCERLVVLSTGCPTGFGRADLAQLQRYWYILMFQTPEAEEFLRRDDWRGLRLLAPQHPDLGGVIDRWGDPAALTAALGFYRANTSPRSFTSWQPPARNVGVPTLAILGADDPYGGRAQMEASAQFVESSWTLEVIDDAGHWVQVDQSATVSASICRFLAT
jgi:pimeloyl-ACP methyl ester carboxylesterase